MRATLKWLILLFVFALVVAACGGDDAQSGTFSDIGDNLSGEARGALGDAPAEAEQPASDEAEDAAADGDATEGGSELGTGGIQPIVQPSDIGRDIIFTADLTVAVTDVGRAGEEATRAVEALGGFLFGQETRGAPTPSSVLTFKILPENFQEALTRLGSLGELRTQNVSADDVTERVVDLESRITTAEASVERLRGFLEGATDIDAIAELEAQLLERETTLETLRGSLRTIRGQIDLATIFLTLTEAQSRPEMTVSVTAYRGHEDAGASCPGDQGLSVDEGDDVTLCYEIFNTGDTNLTDFTFHDPVLDLEIEDVIVVFGSRTDVMEPGQTLVLAAEVTLDRNLRTATRITATPVNPDGERIEGRDVSSTSTFFVQVVDPGGLPGFRDGLQAGWSFLQTVWGLVVLVAGAVLPFVWVPVLLWLWWWRRRRQPSPVVTRTAASPLEDEPGADDD